jgi:autotransporter-associated beta strand protein
LRAAESWDRAPELLECEIELTIGSSFTRTGIWLIALLGLLAASPSLRAATLYFDADLNPLNNDLGTGAGLGWSNAPGSNVNWNNGPLALNWYDGTLLTAWVQDSDAVFWGSAGAIGNNGGTNPRTVNSIDFRSSGYVINGPAISLTNTSATPGPLPSGTINVVSGTATINAVLGGTIGLTKTGGGTLVLGGVNTYTGTTVITAGTLQLSAGDRLANGSHLTVSGGTFNLGTFSETIGNVVLTSGSIIGTGTLTGNSYTVESGLISAKLAGAAAALTKNGPGTVTLAGVNTYGGTTSINGGTLLVNGSLASGATVNAGATLGGTGTINGTVMANGSGSNLAAVSPGASIGTLTVGNMAFGEDSELVIEITPDAADLLNVLGLLTIQGGAKLTFDISGPLTLPEYQIVSLGALSELTIASGTFLTSFLPVNYQVEYRYGDVEDRGIFLTQAVIPLPMGAWMAFSGLVTLVLGGCVARRRIPDVTARG